MSKTYQDEKNELLEWLLNNAVYPRLGTDSKAPPFFKLELYVTTTCNKKCEYCYLQKYDKGLYPQEFNTNENILNNTKILFNYFTENNIHIHYIDIFSGEIVGTQLYFDLLDILLDNAEQIQLREILIPTNASFLNEDMETILKVEEYIALFAQKKIDLHLSLSDDGYVLDEINRPLKTNESQNKTTNDYYDKMAKFALRNNCGFHPMVNAHSIDLWNDNLDWWIEWCQKNFNMSFFDRSLLLEVRNDEWDDHALVGYIKFFKHFIEKVYESFNGNLSLENFLIYLMEPWRNTFTYKDGTTHIRDINTSYAPYKIRNDYRISCAYTQSFCIRLGDLAICPCHRTSYEHLIIGQYNIENNKIVGITAKNVQTMLNNYIVDSRANLKCDSCTINQWCLKGCHGAQYEIYKDINYPIESVCKLQKIKVMYVMINMLYWCNQTDIHIPKEQQFWLQKYVKILAALEQEDKEFYDKWKTIIYQTMLNF